MALKFLSASIIADAMIALPALLLVCALASASRKKIFVFDERSIVKLNRGEGGSLFPI